MSLQIKDNRAVTVGPNLRYKPPARDRPRHVTTRRARITLPDGHIKVRDPGCKGWDLPTDLNTAAELRTVREYEKRNKNRETLIEQFDRKLKAASA